MSILDRSALEESPLADLHAIASELSIDGYRRLRKPELIDAILGRQGRGEGEAEPDAARQEPDAEAEPEAAREEPEAEAEPVAPPADLAEEPTSAEPEELTEAVAEELGARAGDRAGIRRRRGRRGGRGRAGGPDDREELEARERREEPEARERREEPEAREERGKREDREDTEPRAKREAHEEAPEPEHAGETQPLERPAEEIVEGVVELLANGSGFMRVHPPDPSDDDVYISAAQVKRCDLVSGDRISGPRRAPRRSERFASLVRVDTINDRPAAEVADSSRFDELPVAFPSERLRLGSEDPTITAIESLAPIGRGSRVVIAGPAQAGKTEALRRIAPSWPARTRSSCCSRWSACAPRRSQSGRGSRSRRWRSARRRTCRRWRSSARSTRDAGSRRAGRTRWCSSTRSRDCPRRRRAGRWRRRAASATAGRSP